MAAPAPPLLVAWTLDTATLAVHELGALAFVPLQALRGHPVHLVFQLAAFPLSSLLQATKSFTFEPCLCPYTNSTLSTQYSCQLLRLHRHQGGCRKDQSFSRRHHDPNSFIQASMVHLTRHFAQLLHQRFVPISLRIVLAAVFSSQPSWRVSQSFNCSFAQCSHSMLSHPTD